MAFPETETKTSPSTFKIYLPMAIEFLGSQEKSPQEIVELPKEFYSSYRQLKYDIQRMMIHNVEPTLGKKSERQVALYALQAALHQFLDTVPIQFTGPYVEMDEIKKHMLADDSGSVQKLAELLATADDELDEYYMQPGRLTVEQLQRIKHRVNQLDWMLQSSQFVQDVLVKKKKKTGELLPPQEVKPEQEVQSSGTNNELPLIIGEYHDVQHESLIVSIPKQIILPHDQHSLSFLIRIEDKQHEKFHIGYGGMTPLHDGKQEDYLLPFTDHQIEYYVEIRDVARYTSLCIDVITGQNSPTHHAVEVVIPLIRRGTFPQTV